jgi:cytidyltransferase-like protein
MAVPVSESIAFSVGITMPVAYTIGRFQPPTIGHKSLIERVKAAANGGPAYVFVSSTTTPKDKNPLTSTDKIPILNWLVPGVTYVDTAVCKTEEGWKKACGGAIAAFYYLLDHEKKPAEDIVLVVGDDHTNDFGPGAAIWGRGEERMGPGGKTTPATSFVLVPSAKRDSNLDVKDVANMSGTKARQYVKLGRKEDFYLAVGADDDAKQKAVKGVYDKIAAMKGGHTYNLRPLKRQTEEVADSVLETGTGPDAEFTYGGGRRRTYRRCRKCGLPKKPETQ